MQGILRNLLQELHQRCIVVKELVANGTFLPPADTYARGLYVQVETLRRDVERLLQDPALGTPALITQQFQVYTRLAETFQAIEAYPLPVVQRFNMDDQRMTALCAVMLRQSNVPLPPPLVVAFSTNYYWTTPSFNLIFASALESNSLLGLPDLYHEVAHFLIEIHWLLFVAAFFQELDDYITQEKRRALMAVRPGGVAPYDMMQVQWQDYWVIEFIADMIATYLIGEAYAWQNLRLCSRTSDTVFVPALGQQGTHPADDARMKAITLMLEEIGEGNAAQAVRQKWQVYITALGDAPVSPGDYALCYPDVLMMFLVQKVRVACEQLGLRKASERNAVQEPLALASLIHEAWVQFLTDSVAYVSWEQQRMRDLQQFLQRP